MRKPVAWTVGIACLVSLLANFVLCDRLRGESGRRIVVLRASRERIVEPAPREAAASVPRSDIKAPEHASAPDTAPARGEGGGVIRKSEEARTVEGAIVWMSGTSSASSNPINYYTWSSCTDPLKTLESGLGLTAAQRDFIDQAIRSQLDYEQRKKYDEMRASRNGGNSLMINGDYTIDAAGKVTFERSK